MLEKALSLGIAYPCFGLELLALCLMCFRGRWRRLTSVFVYLALLLALDGVGRSYVLHRYGQHSPQYAYFFWVSDDVLALAAFLVVSDLFRRASKHQPRLWLSLRLVLAGVFLAVVAVTSLSLLHNLNHLLYEAFTRFEQYLYFACLLLISALYILMQRAGTKDRQLSLLLSGMGLQFAGPAATFAYCILTSGGQPSVLTSFALQLFGLGALLTWLYAIVRVEAPEPEVLSRVNREASDDGTGGLVPARVLES